MNETVSWKKVFLAVAIIYFLCPFDLMSGLVVDDLVVLGTALVPFFRRTA